MTKKPRAEEPAEQPMPPEQQPEFKPYRDEKGHFLPGQGANPYSRENRNKSISITNLLKKRLTDDPKEANFIVSRLVSLARHKSQRQLDAIREIMDRLDGKVADKHKVELENPVTIQFVPASRVNQPELPAPKDEPKIEATIKE